MTSEPVPVRILADTTAGLPQDFLRAHPIELVPQVILFGEESLLEEVEIPYPQFVRGLKAASRSPKTAAPPPRDQQLWPERNPRRSAPRRTTCRQAQSER